MYSKTHRVWSICMTLVTHFAYWLVYILSDDCLLITMSPPTKNTYWLQPLFGFYLFLFTSSCLEVSLLSPGIAFGNLSDFPLWCWFNLYFSVFFACSPLFLLLLQFSFFLLSCHSLFHRQAFYFCGGFTLGCNNFLLPLFCFFSTFNGAQKCYMSAHPGPEVDVGTALEDMKISRE